MVSNATEQNFLQIQVVNFGEILQVSNDTAAGDYKLDLKVSNGIAQTSYSVRV